MKTIRIIGLCLAAVFAFSAVVAGSSSAAELLFKVAGSFPILAKGTSAVVAKLQTVNGTSVFCGATDADAKVGDEAPESGTKFAHLFKYSVLFLKCKIGSVGGEKCWTNPDGEASEMITLPTKIGHLGLAGATTAGTTPAVLLLVGSFEFFCKILGSNAKVTVTGDVIGEITKPAPKTKGTELTLSFKQTGGTQALRFFTFSLGFGSGTFDLKTTNILETNALSGQEGKTTLTGPEFELEEHV
jgi:hypothetical protein